MACRHVAGQLQRITKRYVNDSLAVLKEALAALFVIELGKGLLHWCSTSEIVSAELTFSIVSPTLTALFSANIIAAWARHGLF